MSVNIRALAARCCFSVVDKGRSLADELPAAQAKVEGKDKALLQELCFGVIRYLPALEFETRAFIEKPLTGKQRVAHFLVLVGLYQIKHTRIPDHAAVSETVDATKPLKCSHLKGMINGILRNYQRKTESTPEDLPDAVKYCHPSWFIKNIQTAYPENWQSILLENQEKPPMWLRVNSSKCLPTKYLDRLREVDIEFDHIDDFTGAIKLTKAVDVNKLPGFESGDVSIQDGAAQNAAPLLESKSNDRVLDCCAAPGGKTCHILEITPDLKELTAIDIEESRLVRVKENLARLHLDADVKTADAATQDWWHGHQYDRILLDAPCSGTGVIRRHPDIKWLRKAKDIDALVILQQQILENCWSMLKPGGTLLYATCSILPQENKLQIQHFIEKNSDAELIELPQSDDSIGWQILPGQSGMDGFYYAKLVKKDN